MQASWTFADILGYSYSLETCRGSAVLSYVYRANNSNLFKRLHLHTSIWIINSLKCIQNLTLNSTSRMSSQSFSCFEKSQRVTLFGCEERGPNYQEPVQFPLMTQESEDCYWGETGNYVCACVSVCVCVAFVKKMNNVAGCESAFGLRQINLQLAFWIVTAKLLIHFLLDWQRCWPESYLLMFIKSFLEWHHPSTQASFWLLLIGS